MRPTWGRQDPGVPHVGPMNLAIWGAWQNTSDFRKSEIPNYKEYKKAKRIDTEMHFTWTIYVNNESNESCQKANMPDKGNLLDL